MRIRLVELFPSPCCSLRSSVAMAALAAGLLVATGGPTLAAVTSVDLDTPGDGLLSRDPVGGLDWLDLPATVGLSWDQVTSGAGGWLERGFRPATGAEVCALFAAHAYAPEPCPNSLGEPREPAVVSELLDALGATFDIGDWTWAIGTYQDGGTVPDVVGQALLFRSPSVGVSQVLDGHWLASSPSPFIGHFLVRRHVTVYGKAGSFGALPSVLDDGTPLHRVPVPGFAVDPGQSLYFSQTASDGTLFLANLTQSYNQFFSQNCTTGITCFNPDEATCWDADAGPGGAASHVSTLRIENSQGRIYAPAHADPALSGCSSLEPSEALGSDIADVQVLGEGAQEKVVATSLASSGSLRSLGGEEFPAWVEITKQSGTWRVDPGSARFPADLRAANPPTSQQACPALGKPLCNDSLPCPNGIECTWLDPPFTPGGVEYGICTIPCSDDSDCPESSICSFGSTCRAINCGGLNEMATLPASGHVVATQYLGSGVTVLDTDGTPLASFRFPFLSVSNPCFPEVPGADEKLAMAAREVESDPTSTLGDERFAVVYDSVNYELGQLVQEFRYVAPEGATPGAIEPVTPPFIPSAPSIPARSCAQPEPGRTHHVGYDDAGTLWVLKSGLSGPPFYIPLAGHVVAFARDPLTGVRSLERRCPAFHFLTGEPTPVGGDCAADLALGPPRGRNQPDFGYDRWMLYVFQEPWLDSMVSVSIDGQIGRVRRHLSPSGAEFFSSGSLYGLEANRLPGAGTKWSWKPSLHPFWREFYLPIGIQSQSSQVGVVRNNWIYRVPIDVVAEATPAVVASSVPRFAEDGSDIPLSFTLEFPDSDPLVGSANGLYLGRDGGLVSVGSWERQCDPGADACTFTGTVPGTSTVDRAENVAWHGLFHTESGDALHLAGRIKINCAGSDVDTDFDTWCDSVDNCREVANESQLDEDDPPDGFGNACDCDFDGDGDCDLIDVSTLLNDYCYYNPGVIAGGVDCTVDPENPWVLTGKATDMDGDGTVTGLDGLYFNAVYANGTPGPGAASP